MPRPLSKDDIHEVVLDIAEIVKTLATTDKSPAALTLVNREAVPTLRSGSLEKVLHHLEKSFFHLNHSIPVPGGWEVEVSIVEEHVGEGYLEVMWGLRMVGAGSFSVPHVLIRRSTDAYEILLPRLN